MAHFFFNVHGSEELLDAEGAEIRDLAAAERRAVREARALMSADVLQGLLALDRHIQVTCEGSKVLLIVTFEEALRLRGNMQQRV
jgi:hypothetical protein